MTIFLTVLKLLVKDQLKNLIDLQESKMGSVVPFLNYSLYNKDLSKDQKTEMGDLQDRIIRFDGTGNDKADLDTVLKMIDDSRKAIQKLRENHKESRDGGDTVTGYNNLRNHCMAFYDKLKGINKLKTEKKPPVEENEDLGESQDIEVVKTTDFQFMNRSFNYTPENVVYFHAAVYYGDEIFNPQNNGNKDLRDQKEYALLERLIQLSEWIKPSYNLGEQRARVLQVLKDLAGDNIRITQGPTGKSKVPSVSLFGGIASIDVNKWFSPSEGRFGAEFYQAVRTVNKMLPEQFNKSDIDSSEKDAQAPKQEPKAQSKTTPKAQERKDKSEPKAKPLTLFDKPLPKPKTPVKAMKAEEEDEEEVVNTRPSKPKVTPKPSTIKAKKPEPEFDEDLDERVSFGKPNPEDENKLGVDEEETQQHEHEHEEETDEERELQNSL